MKKSRKPKRKSPSIRTGQASPGIATESIRFLRLCHACLFLNDDFREIEGCQQCGHRYSIGGRIRHTNDWRDQIDSNPENDENLETETAEGESAQPLVELTGLSVRW